MNAKYTRRSFLRRTASLSLSVSCGIFSPNFLSARNPGNRVVVGVMGCNNRGMDHLAAYLALPNTEIGYICDVDSRALDKGVARVASKQGKTPKAVKDLRRVLEDPTVDAISIAAPDHWHAPAAILACAAGKHVYVEKPGSHNGHESEQIVAAARKYRRVVQMGNQRRSWPWVDEAMTSLRTGELGNVFFARCWYNNRRPSIGHGKPAPVPGWLNYDLWQGPAPEKAFQDNLIHYNWHWFWHWGTGELGNNGVHALDLARWGLGLEQEYPRRVTCGGNRYHYEDDWQTPDTCIATFDYGHKGIAWEGHSCDPRGFEGTGFGVNFYAENGSLVLVGEQASLYDSGDKLVRQIKGKFDDVVHFSNFLDSIRKNSPLKAEIGDGQKATVLCHLGNIAWRSGRTLTLDPASHKILGDHGATSLWKRKYRKGWEPKV